MPRSAARCSTPASRTAPIYDLALERVARAARRARRRATRVLAIGDSVRTDLKGATDFGIDCLFVTAGIHAEELGDRHDPDLAALNAIFADAGVAPKAVTRRAGVVSAYAAIGSVRRPRTPRRSCS